MPPQTKSEETDMLNLDSKEKDDSLNDGQHKNQCKLTKKPWIIPIGIIIVFTSVTYADAVVYYPREPAENSVLLYEIQKKILQDIGCSPKPEVKNVLSLLPEKDDIGQGDYEIAERFIVIFQCNDYSSFCGVNGICTCESTENGQTNATAIIKFRNRHIRNSEWQYVHRTLNIKNHTECVSKVENSVQQLYENQKKLLQGIGCSPKPVVKNVLSLLTAKDDLGDYEIEERLIAIFQCNDNSSFCGVNGTCTCEPTENGQTTATVIIKFRDRHNKSSEWQYEHRTLNIKNHTECVSKVENKVQLYEIQNKVLQDIGCSPKPEVKNMLSLLPENDDIGLGDYEIEESFIVIFQCNDYSSFCGVNGICTCEPTENGQTNATAIIKFRYRHIKNSEWQYEHRTLNIMNHTECVAKAFLAR